jgi:hypothetical protein
LTQNELFPVFYSVATRIPCIDAFNADIVGFNGVENQIVAENHHPNVFAQLRAQGRGQRHQGDVGATLADFTDKRNRARGIVAGNEVTDILKIAFGEREKGAGA